MAIISQTDSEPIRQGFDFAGSCAEFSQLLFSAIHQTGYDDFLMHINPTTTPIDNFHNQTLLTKVVTACSPKAIILLYVLNAI